MGRTPIYSAIFTLVAWASPISAFGQATVAPLKEIGIRIPPGTDRLVIPLTRGRELLLVKVAVNGQEAGWFFVDTGANHSAIDIEVAKRLKLRGQWETEARLVGGQKKSQICEVGDVSLNGTSSGPRYIAMVDFSLGKKNGLHIAGVIGTDILSDLPFTINFREPSLTFDRAGKVPEDVKAKAAAIKVQFEGDLPSFQAALEGHSGQFALDTGMMGFDVAASESFALHDMKARSARHSWHYANEELGGMHQAEETRFDGFELAGKLYNDLRGSIESRDAESHGFVPRSCVATIGPQVLRDSRFTWDAEHEAGWIEHLPVENPDNYIRRIEADNLRASPPTPLLIRAIEEKHLDAAKELIDSGVDLNEKDNSTAETALMAAVYDADLVKLLLARGANPHLKDETSSALTEAAKRRNLKSVRALIAAGAKLEHQPEEAYALTWAAAANAPEVVQALLQAPGKDKNVLPAVEAAVDSGNKELLAMLLKQKPNLKLEPRSGVGALHRAGSSGNDELGRMLLDAGADVNQLDHEGRTPLHWAAAAANAKLARLLLQAGADPNLKDKSGRTPLDVAAANWDMRTLQAMKRLPDWSFGVPDGAQTAKIPLARWQNWPCVRLVINGQDAGWFILSLKTTSMIIDTKIADKLKLAKVDAVTPRAGYEVRLAKDISINRLSAGSRIILATDLEKEPFRGGQFSGYLDRSFLLDHPSVLDLKEMVVTLYRDGALPDDPPARGQALRVDYSRVTPAVWGALNGTGGWFWLECKYSKSLGLSHSFFGATHAELLKDAHVLREPTLSTVKTTDELSFPVNQFDFAGKRLSDRYATIETDDSAPWQETPDGAIGCPSPNGRLTLDAGSNRAWYGWNDPEDVQAYLKRVEHELAGPFPATPLMRSLRDRRFDAAALLIEQGADVNVRDVGDFTPLMLAISHPELIKLLLAKGADPNAKAAFLAKTPLIFAAADGNVETVKSLIAAGAKLDQATTQGRTAMSVAAQANYPDVIDLLASAGADVNHPDQNNRTPLMFAAGANSQAAATVLLKHHATLHRSDQRTAMEIAASEEHLEMLRMFIKAGGSVNQTSSSGTTPLMHAAAKGKVSATRLLIAAGADPTLKAQGMTAYDFAAANQQFDVMRVLKFEVGFAGNPEPK